MSREVRRVPLDWRHPVEPNPYWQEQEFNRRFGPDWARHPESRLHGVTERFVGLMDDYAGRLAEWQREGAELAERRGSHWEFSVKWHLTGYDACSCHPGQPSVKHPVYGWTDDGQTEIVLPIVTEDELHAHELAQHAGEEPDPANYMPAFDVAEDELGWCLYETVSEGTPVTPIFATAEELVQHLSTVGQDWDQVPMRREAAATLVRQGHSFGSMVSIGSTLYRSDRDADLIAGATQVAADATTQEVSP